MRAILNKFSPFLKQIVMAFIHKGKKVTPKVTPKVNSNPPLPLNSKDNLDKQELTLILNMIKENRFKGEDIELLYKLVIKLQNQYLKIKD
jgi:hypothetical protein